MVRSLLYDKDTEYHLLQPFGCACFPCLQPYNEHKLEFHSQKCIYLGPASNQKGYKCLTSTGKIYVSRHVVFDSSVFPSHTGFLNRRTSSAEHEYLIPISIVPSFQRFPPIPADVAQISPARGSASPTASFQNSGARSHLPSGAHSSLSPSGSNSVSKSDNHRPTTNEPNLSHSSSRAPLTPSRAQLSLTPLFDQVSPQVVSPESIGPPVEAQNAQHLTNLHSMTTRAKEGIFKPKHPFVGLLYTETSSLRDQAAEPTSVSQALTLPHWKSAMREEFEALQRNRTWNLVPFTGNEKLVDCRWIFKTKFKPDGTILKHKARLVAKGYQQEEGVDYSETFSPVVKPTTVRIVLTLAATLNWEVRQLDVNNAFLNGILHENVYMRQPEGFSDSRYPDHICKLTKALYGLKQAPRAWFDRLSTTLQSSGFCNSKSDTSLFYLKTEQLSIFIFIYVDDILITGNNQTFLSDFVQKLNTFFSLKDLGSVYYFLGIEICRTSEGFHLSQSKYIVDLLTRFGLKDCATVDTPMVTGKQFSKNIGVPLGDPTLYRRMVGSLQYLLTTRPEIAFAVNKLSQFLAGPTDIHLQAVKRVFRYLKGTHHIGLHLKPCKQLQLTTYTDADWATNIDDRKSSAGFCVFLGDSLISWSSRKQRVVSRSSTESEYRSLADGAAEVRWIASLFSELGFSLRQPCVMKCDNLSARALASNPVQHCRSKHIEIDIHFVRDLVLSGFLDIQHVSSSSQIADCLTKALSFPQFALFRNKLGLSITPSRLRGALKTNS